MIEVENKTRLIIDIEREYKEVEKNQDDYWGTKDVEVCL